MQHHLPMKGESVVCKDCEATTPDKFADCQHPCVHLISWVANKVRWQVVQEMSHHNFITEVYDKPDFNSVGGD